jgi:phosphocarrier protein
MCEEAVKYNSKITFEYGKDKTANAKSVISILAAGVKCGDVITLYASGEDEQQALDAVAGACIKSMREEK